MLKNFLNFLKEFDVISEKDMGRDVNFPASELKKKQPAFYALIDSLYQKVYGEKCDEEVFFYYVYALLKFFERNFPDFNMDKKVNFKKMLENVENFELSSDFTFERDFMDEIFLYLNEKLMEELEEEGLFKYKKVFSDALYSIIRTVELEFFKREEHIN